MCLVVSGEYSQTPLLFYSNCGSSNFTIVRHHCCFILIVVVKISHLSCTHFEFEVLPVALEHQESGAISWPLSNDCY